MTFARGFLNALLVGTACVGLPAAAQAGTGVPSPWQVNLQGMVTDLGQFAATFHNYITVLMALICLFVLGLLVYCVVKFNERANPVPSKTTHHAALEVAWTLVPVLILVAIAIPSFRLLRDQMIIPKHDVVLKVTGYQWYWGYEYPADQGGIKFEQRIIADPSDQTKAQAGPNGAPKLLAVDNEAVVPVNKVVRIQVTAFDVMHSYSVPSFGFKLDAIPGRLNEMWFKAEREGVYYGQCSELCGQYHAYMPLAIRVVSEEAYARWLEEAKTKFARTDDAADVKLAADARR